jgi:ATP-dependent Clp protease protease subunit
MIAGKQLDLSMAGPKSLDLSMVAGGAQAMEEMYDGVRIGPPPDLPSLLLHNRIVYIGMPLVPAVTELIIAELLYLNYEDTSKPITMYINSSGTTTADGQSVGFETEAFAIADVMKYVRPPVCTIAVGQAFGE